MTDHKFDREDRQIVLHDFKQRLIDLTENPYILPDDVGIYDEPVRYFKANEQWCKIIFGWLHWLEGVAGWKDAQDPNFAGIQAILQFEEGIEPMSIDYEALKNAIRDGMYEFGNDIAKQIVSGRTTNIGVDADGNVSDPSTSDPDAGLPPDDPETGGDETLEAKAGGANAIRLGCNLIWSQMTTWTAAGVTAADTKTRLKSIYILDDAETDVFVDQYYSDRTASLPLPASWANSLDSYMFCKGANLQILARFVFEVVTASTQAISLKLVNALTQAQLDAWFSQGSQVPSTDYVDFSCVKTPSETVIVNLDNNVSYNGVQIWKINHRIRLTVEGFAVDPQGDRLDFWWNKSAAGVLTFKNSDTQIRVNGTVQEDATQNEVVWNAAGRYSWTFVNANNGIIDFRINRGTGIDASLTYTFSVLVEDLGEILT